MSIIPSPPEQFGKQDVFGLPDSFGPHPLGSYMIRVYSIALSFLMGVTSISAADWSDATFPIKSHDFGTVAVAAKTEFSFPIHNNSSKNLHIRSVRASCGCTTPIVENKSIGPNQTGSILARFNTDTFRGKRGATLTVIIDQPFYTEVRLRVDGYIRSDMVFNPVRSSSGRSSRAAESRSPRRFSMQAEMTGKLSTCSAIGLG